MGDQSAQSSPTYRVPALCAGNDRARYRAQQPAYRLSRRFSRVSYRGSGNPDRALHRWRLPRSCVHPEAQHRLRIHALSEGRLVRELELATPLVRTIHLMSYKAIYTYAWDLAEEGVDKAADQFLELGLDTVTIAG